MRGGDREQDEDSQDITLSQSGPDQCALPATSFQIRSKRVNSHIDQHPAVYTVTHTDAAM